MLRSILSSLLLLSLGIHASARDLWTPEAATAWYASQPWMVGANFIPRNAINQLEMWQQETFDPVTIDQELGWAEGLGYSTMRVFLHNLLWEQDAAGFTKRIDQVLTIAGKHHIRLMLVLFDACWDPNPKLGPQRAPKPHVHNSGWMQAPGRAVLMDPVRVDALKDYVVGIVSHFKNDHRVVLWDIFNEFNNGYGGADTVRVLALAGKATVWALSADPTQPVSCCIWENCGAPHDRTVRSPAFPGRHLRCDHLPCLCRPRTDRRCNQRPQGLPPALDLHRIHGAGRLGSTFKDILPLFKEEKITAYNWGFVDGKTQTKFPWDSNHKAYGDEPPIWFHDVLHGDGTPYDATETSLIRTLTGKTP
jgi:hypothetical protein